jgi:hypothetical protein
MHDSEYPPFFACTGRNNVEARILGQLIFTLRETLLELESLRKRNNPAGNRTIYLKELIFFCDFKN